MTDNLVQRLRTELLEWLDKTKWVRQTCQTHELGLHRADILRDRIEALTAENFKLAAGSCVVEGGKVGDKHGHFYCTLQAKVEALTADNEQWQVDYNEAVIDKLELETENHLLRVAAQRLGTYSAHDDDCRIMTHGVWSDPIPCTCGYTDAWQALAALEKKP